MAYPPGFTPQWAMRMGMRPPGTPPQQGNMGADPRLAGSAVSSLRTPMKLGQAPPPASNLATIQGGAPATNGGPDPTMPGMQGGPPPPTINSRGSLNQFGQYTSPDQYHHGGFTAGGQPQRWGYQPPGSPGYQDPNARVTHDQQMGGNTFNWFNQNPATGQYDRAPVGFQGVGNPRGIPLDNQGNPKWTPDPRSNPGYFVPDNMKFGDTSANAELNHVKQVNDYWNSVGGGDPTQAAARQRYMNQLQGQIDRGGGAQDFQQGRAGYLKDKIDQLTKLAGSKGGTGKMAQGELQRAQDELAQIQGQGQGGQQAQGGQDQGQGTWSEQAQGQGGGGGFSNFGQGPPGQMGQQLQAQGQGKGQGTWSDQAQGQGGAGGGFGQFGPDPTGQMGAQLGAQPAGWRKGSNQNGGNFNAGAGGGGGGFSNFGQMPAGQMGQQFQAQGNGQAYAGGTPNFQMGAGPGGGAFAQPQWGQMNPWAMGQNGFPSDVSNQQMGWGGGMPQPNFMSGMGGGFPGMSPQQYGQTMGGMFPGAMPQQGGGAYGNLTPQQFNFLSNIPYPRPDGKGGFFNDAGINYDQISQQAQGMGLNPAAIRPLQQLNQGGSNLDAGNLAALNAGLDPRDVFSASGYYGNPAGGPFGPQMAPQLATLLGGGGGGGNPWMQNVIGL